MADQLISQPTQNPTRKLTSAVVAAAIVAIGQTIADIYWPGAFDQKFWTAMFPIAAYAAGYFTKDEVNVVIQQEVIETSVPVEAAE